MTPSRELFARLATVDIVRGIGRRFLLPLLSRAIRWYKSKEEEREAKKRSTNSVVVLVTREGR